MRQLNIAQRSANIIASLRDCAFVAGNAVRMLRLHLLHALTGSSKHLQRYERGEKVSRGISWYGMSPAMIPATLPSPTTTTGNRLS
jgi:hypothetical protein